MTNDNASKSLLGAGSIHHQGSADPEQVLKDLKQMQKDKQFERKQQYSNIPGTTTLPSIKK